MIFKLFSALVWVIFILLSSHQSYGEENIGNDFVKRFHLEKSKEVDIDKYYYMLTKKSPKELRRQNNDGIDVRIFPMKNEKLEEKELMLFNLVTYQCHACNGELWLFDKKGKIPLIQLHDSLSSEFATNLDILDIIELENKVYIFAKTYFMAQGEVERTRVILKYDLKTQNTREVFRFFVSDTDFGLDFPKCTGIKTKYKIDLESDKPNVSFYQKGHECDDRKNAKRISVKKVYYFK